MTDTTDPQADRLKAAARRALESLNDLILDSRDPGPEAIAARYELEQVLLTSSAGPAPATDPTERRDRWETQYARYDAHDYRDLAAIGMAIADAEQAAASAAVPSAPAARAAGVADVIRSFPFDNFGMDDVSFALEDDPEAQDWVPALAAAVLAVLPAPAARAASTAPLASGLPHVQGRCPACGTAGLFLGSGGYVTCSSVDCPEPDAATTVLERMADEAQQPEAQAQSGCAHRGPHPGFTCGEVDASQPYFNVRWNNGQAETQGALLATRCDACRHTLNWHRNDIGCTVALCVCSRFQQPAAVSQPGKEA
jgi:hypothetical protein